MFSLRGLDVIKERALQSLQEQLDQVGLKNDYINKQVNKCASDVQLSEFLELCEKLSRSLESLLEAATVFHKGACVMQESAKSVRGVGVGGGGIPGDAYEVAVAHGPILFQTYDEETLRLELQATLTKPVRRKLRELADIRNRVKEASVLHLEVVACKDLAERLRAKPNANAAKLAKAEDQFAGKQVQYDQMLLRLTNEQAILQRDHEAIFQKAFASLKTCEHRFALTAAATLATLMPEADVSAAAAAADVGAGAGAGATLAATATAAAASAPADAAAEDSYFESSISAPAPAPVSVSAVSTPVLVPVPEKADAEETAEEVETEVEAGAEAAEHKDLDAVVDQGAEKEDDEEEEIKDAGSKAVAGDVEEFHM